MFERFIRFLIGILLVGLCVFLLVWTLGIVGIHIPQTVMMILYAIAVLLCILMAWRFFGGYLSNPFIPPPDK